MICMYIQVYGVPSNIHTTTSRNIYTDIYVCTSTVHSSQLPAKPFPHLDLLSEKEEEKKYIQRPKAARPPAGISTTLLATVYFA